MTTTVSAASCSASRSPAIGRNEAAGRPSSEDQPEADPTGAFIIPLIQINATRPHDGIRWN
jgi:hypothetical protein